MSKFQLKRGEVGVSVTVVLMDAGGPVDLTGSDVRFLAKDNVSDLIPKINGVAVPDADQDINKGRVTYIFGAGDLDTAGHYYVEWSATWGISNRKFPNGGYDELVVLEDLS